MATNSLGLTVDVSSSTKDSISVRWRLEGPGGGPGGPGGSSSVQRASVVQGFEVRYQAIGSTIVQQSHRLDASASAYDIVQLHENTYYDICVKAFTSLNASSSSSGSPSVPSIQAASGQSSSSSSSSAVSSHTDACIKGTTATDSLWVALGSTFGAFLALGFIVFLVFLAKWQHSRNERKQKLMTSAYDDARVQQLRECDDDDDDDDDYDPKGSSSGVHLPDDLAMSELSGHSSELSIALYADDHLTANDDDDDDDDDDDQRLQDHRRHQHGWIAATPYEAAEGEREDEEDGDRRRSIDDDDSGIQKELLRPPPIPGIILRPVQSTAGQPGSDQIRPKSSSSSDRRLGSTERGSGDANSGRRQDEDEEDEGNAPASADASASTGHGIVACHPPLKPTASNLW